MELLGAAAFLLVYAVVAFWLEWYGREKLAAWLAAKRIAKRGRTCDR